tara:strand:- start:10044 stop:11360 length:1317 start_codon:yes stop_codon:yes gene_type:complete
MGKKIKIAVVGLWHQGVVASACLTKIGHDVTGLDAQDDKIQSLNLGQSPIYEPRLNYLLKKGLKSKHLKFSTDYSVTRDADLIILSHDTPVNEKDESDLSIIYQDLKKIIPYIKSQIIHITAQVPAGTSNKLVKLIQKRVKNFNNLAYTPENLRLGSAIERYMNPPLPVIGVSNEKVFKQLKLIYKSLSNNWQKTDLLSSEMVKHGLNTFLATSLSLANELGNISDSLGANGQEVGRLLKLEPRIGKYALMRPGLGFAGGTLARDVKTLNTISHSYQLKTPLLNSILRTNDVQNNLPIDIISKIFRSKLKNKKITVLGLTYKANTSTLRRSYSLEIIRKLQRMGANVSCYDPKADRNEVKRKKYLNFYESLDEACSKSDLLLVATPWKEFHKINFKNILKLVNNKHFFDLTGMFCSDLINKIGFKYIAIGDGSLHKVL